MPSPIAPGARHGYSSHLKLAPWRSGYAADCKSVHPGSIPGGASKASLTQTLRRTADSMARNDCLEGDRDSVLVAKPARIRRTQPIHNGQQGLGRPVRRTQLKP